MIYACESCAKERKLKWRCVAGIRPACTFCGRNRDVFLWSRPGCLILLAVLVWIFL